MGCRDQSRSIIGRGEGRVVDFLEGFTRVAVLTDEGGNVHPVGVLWKRNLAALGKTPSRKLTQRLTPDKIEFSSTRDRTRSRGAAASSQVDGGKRSTSLS